MGDEICVEVDLFEALINMVLNTKSIREFPKDVRDSLEEGDRATLDLAVNVLNAYNREHGREEIH